MALSKYSAWTLMRSAKIFFLVWVIITVFMGSMVTIMSGATGSDMMFNGYDSSSGVFVFICAIVLFSELFKVAMATSRTRKDVFISAVSVAAPFAILLAVTNQIISFSLSFFMDSQTFFKMMYLGGEKGAISIGDTFTALLWDSCLLIMLFAVGFLIGMLYYRLSKLGKVVLSFTVFGIPFMIFPMLDGILTEGETIVKVLSFIGRCLGINDGNPFWAVLSFLSVAVVMFGVSFLVLRRLPLKKA